jgi:PAS domain S-box-containing protein
MHRSSRSRTRSGDGIPRSGDGIPRSGRRRRRRGPITTAMADYRGLLRSFLETTSDIVAFKDRDGRYIALSRSFYRGFGHKSPDALLGQTDAAVLPPAEAAARVADDVDVATTGKSLGPMEEQVTVLGRPLWISWTKQPLHDENGDVVGSFMVTRDITARKEAELAIHEQKERLTRIVETQRELAETSDRVAANELVCRRAVELTRGEGAAVLLLDGDHLVFAGGSGLHYERGTTVDIEGSLTGWSLRQERAVVIPDVDVDPRFAAVRAHGLRSGVGVPLRHGDRKIGVLQVISSEPDAFDEEDRSTVELLAVMLSEFLSRAAEAEALARFEAVYRGAPIGIGILDLDGGFTEANARLLDITSSGPASLRLADCVHPDDRGPVEDGFSQLVRGDEEALFVEHRLHRPDGELVWAQTAVSLVRDGSGRPSFAVAMLMDVTKQKLAEQELRRKEVETRTSHKLEAVGQLASGIAHEINTPVQFVGDSVRFLDEALQDTFKLLDAYRSALANADPAVRAALERAEDECDIAYIEERLPRVFERLYGGVERVSSLVKAMKSFAHTSQVEKAPADLNEAIKTTLTVARSEYKYVADVELELGELPAVVCNVSDLNQVFLNLIVNAAHAIEDAKAGTEERGTIRIRSRAEPGVVVLTFSDDGCGIPDDVRSRIFDPFFTTKEVGRGSGQGLAIAHNIVVDRHGGTLACEGSTRGGTTFVIRLPLGEDVRRAA